MECTLSSADARSIFALVEECCELWNDAIAWQHHLVASTERLLGGFCGWLLMYGRRDDAPDFLGASLGDAVDESSARKLTAFLAAGGATTLPGADSLRESVRGRRSRSFRLPELSSPEEYYASRFYQEHMRPLRAHDVMSGTALDGSSILTTLGLCREPSERPFGERERAMFGLLAESIGTRVGKRLATQRHKGRHHLSPREQMTLDALVAGDSEKQIAARLGISINTVHDYVKSLHRQFEVHSRGELLSYLVRREPELAPPSRRASRRPTPRMALAR